VCKEVKKTSTYLYFGLALLNGFMGLCTCHISKSIFLTYTDLLEGMRLPDLTRLCIAIAWWPYLVAAFCIAGLIISNRARRQSPILLHGVIAVLIVDVLLMFVTLVAYVIPLVPSHFPGQTCNF
jgi:hypothetical protein